jgi:hypothetical protein
MQLRKYSLLISTSSSANRDGFNASDAGCLRVAAPDSCEAEGEDDKDEDDEGGVEVGEIDPDEPGEEE